MENKELKMRCMDIINEAIDLNADYVSFEYDKDIDRLFDIFVIRKGKPINIYAYKDGHFEDKYYNAIDNPEIYIYEFLEG